MGRFKTHRFIALFLGCQVSNKSGHHFIFAISEPFLFRAFFYCPLQKPQQVQEYLHNLSGNFMFSFISALELLHLIMLVRDGFDSALDGEQGQPLQLQTEDSEGLEDEYAMKMKRNSDEINSHSGWKRHPYGYGLGKRDPYGYGLGKREPYGYGLGKRDPYGYGLGKRQPYGYGLGKRDPYGYGLGKRQPYGYGLGKRAVYAYGLGKREPYGYGLGKRDPYGYGLGKREPYGYGLGK